MRAGLRRTAGAVAGACIWIVASTVVLSGRGGDTWLVSMQPSADVDRVVQTSQDWAQAEPLIGMDQPADPQVDLDPSVPGRPDDRTSLPVVHRVPLGDQSIPATVLAAYQQAADRVALDDPSCGLRWQVLAGIGKVESGHARGGRLTRAGDAVPRILGPVLNGAGPVAAISDHDGGRWDLDPEWDRAVGPMQFIPGTWSVFGVDGSADGIADPNNVFDATLSAGRYLCAGESEVRTATGLAAALRRYNNSLAYVAKVMSWIEAYDNGNAVPAEDAGPDTGATSEAPRPAPTPAVPNTPSPTPVPSPSPTPSPTMTPTMTPTPTPTASPSPTCATASPTPTPTPTSTPTPTPTPTPTVTPTPTPTPTGTPTPTPSGCPTP